MKNTITLITSIIIGTAVCVMATDYADVTGTDKNRLIYEMRDNQSGLANGTRTLANGLTITGTITATSLAGSVAASGDVVLSATSDLRFTPSTSAPNNATIITNLSSYIVVTPGGAANGYTNTCTLANASASGQWLIIAVDSAATNLLGLADSGNLKLSAAFAGDGDDTISLISVDTNWVETSRSSN